MKKLLPMLLAAVVATSAIGAAYLTPLYPIYAQTTPETTSGPAFLTAPKAMPLDENALKNRGEGIAMMAREQNASRSALFKLALDKFKDKNKATRAQNISNSLNNINKRWTSQMQQNMEKISQILEKLKAKASAAGVSGQDVTAINSAIANAEVEWANADTALKSQLENDYSIAVSGEANIKQDAMTAKNSLQTDLKSVHMQIVQARQALSNAINTTASTLGGIGNGQ